MKMLLTLHVEKYSFMKPRLYHIILAVLTGWSVISCNSDDSEVTVIESTTLSNVEVKYFGLGSAPLIAENTDTLFFSIDLNNGVIFNADSLPAGTVKGNVTVDLTVESASQLEVLFTDKEGEPQTINYFESSNDSVYFGNDDVKVRIVSADGKVQRDYVVKLNVHEKKPDSLYWDVTNFAMLPTTLGSPAAQKTVEMGGRYYTLASDGRSATIAVTDNPADRRWSISQASLPSGSDVATLSSVDGILYITALHKLYLSADGGKTWRDTGASMDYIYGGYGATVLGNKKNADGSYSHVTYPATAEKPVAEDCPVKGTSAPMTFTTQWSDKAMFAMLGGRKAGGTLTGSMWAYDGSEWAAVSLQSLPPVEGAVMIPYYHVTHDIQYVASSSPVLLAFGGNYANGQLNDKVYMSVDQGVHWAEAPAYMQPGSNAPLLTGAQALVVNQTLYPEASRAVKPISSWECPYIYLFGGVSYDGFSPSIKRGYINYFTFFPIQ